MRDDDDPTSGRRIQVQFKTTEATGGSRVGTGGEMNVDELSFSVPAKRKAGAVGLEDRARVGGRGGGSVTEYPSPNGGSNTIRCICSITMDDGLSIACDVCDRWCHAACFDIVLGEIPDEWKCSGADGGEAEAAAGCFGRGVGTWDTRRREGEETTEGCGWGAWDDGEEEEAPVTGPSAPTPAEVPEDDLVDIEDSWATSYVHIQDDIITSDEMRHNLLRQAQQWRGVSALSSPSKIAVKSVDPSLASFVAMAFVRTHESVAHATSSIPTGTLISPFTSVVTPSSIYVNDSFNGYAVMGHPKPFVHLVGAPWNVALDARMAGNESRFVRVGCRPNAVLRPVLCGEPKEGDDSGLKFGVFATQDLKENEEIVLGWEWDDGNVVHRLPAIVQDPWMFTDRPRETTGCEYPANARFDVHDVRMRREGKRLLLVREWGGEVSLPTASSIIGPGAQRDGMTPPSLHAGTGRLSTTTTTSTLRGRRRRRRGDDDEWDDDERGESDDGKGNDSMTGGWRKILSDASSLCRVRARDILEGSALKTPLDDNVTLAKR
ncbi:hypothetical protein D9611_015142 [Ephemerocybe angulata]|uniref:SET domain-containing protein n=1 Tax=Ephemerocybe angulata TaxID=980116 RepID=A0A8H5AQG1_9AGAR|nr:hypothetical protein D9611_015142 [Tulosesus angulatus]